MKKRKSMRKALAMLAALLITLGQGVPAVEALTVLENNAESAIVDSGSSISDESNESFRNGIKQSKYGNRRIH